MKGNADFVRDAEFAIGKPEFGKNQNQKSASNLALQKATAGSQPNLGSNSGLASKFTGSTEKLASKPNVATQSQGAALDADMTSAIKELRNDKGNLTWYIPF
jgi:hypothetical protein